MTTATRPLPIYVRAPQHDRRIARGDDFAGDAWRTAETGAIEWGAVGVDRNKPEETP